MKVIPDSERKRAFHHKDYTAREEKRRLINMQANYVRKWREDPIAFVKEAVGADPTKQQQAVLRDIGLLEKAKILRGMGKALPRELLPYDRKFGISIMSGHGTGKGALLAWLILRIIVCLPRPKVMVTASVGHQIKAVVWAEVVKWLNRRNEQGEYVCKLRDLITVQSDKIFLTSAGGKDSFVEPRTASPSDSAEKQGETLAGRHEDYLVIMADEASGIPEAVFKPIEGTLTGLCNYVIMTFNPTRRTGYAFETHYGKGKDFWIHHRWNSEECERIGKEQIAMMREKYGVDSNAYRIRVLGLPPTTEDGSVIPWEWAYAAVDRDIQSTGKEPIVIGVDVGRQGDSTVVLVRQGPEILELKEYKEDDLTKTASHVMGAIAEWEPEATYIDVCGLGWGVYDIIRQHYDRLYAVNVAEKSRRPDRFDRLRDELWWAMRDRFEKGLIKLPNDDGLIGELTGPKFQMVGKDSIKIEGKREMKRRGLPSPNKADALGLTYYLDDACFGMKGTSDEKPGRYSTRRRSNQSIDWMGV